ncbi:HPr-rel-A system PqqD family peptide chaperone [Sphingobium bisphenolivorans]|uniref:HPr-rel-A system PqqD family peptide chaperone n=1 Tax=Sphingobium bisphenolivorans TaxID=1335760 RepID=UPI0003A410D3|nr:HPr-rel-A system PqqD family peptide chaperone [Sphingobium bisphenolivorans]
MTVSLYYRQDGPDALVACALEEMLLLYHRPSGQTHMVISPVPEILGELTAGPLAAGEIVDRLAQRYELGARDQAVGAVEAHLAEMTALGLVRAA